MLAIGLIVIGLLARFVVHIPNFTPVIAIALFAGVYLSKKNALWLPIVLLAVSDIFLGFHATMPFTWGSVMIVALLGMWLKQHKSVANTLGSSVLSALIFYVVSNFGVWLLAGFYPMTFAGLVECYVAAVPFFRTLLGSTLMYTIVLFGVYELAARQIRKTQLAFVLSNDA